MKNKLLKTFFPILATLLIAIPAISYPLGSRWINPIVNGTLIHSGNTAQTGNVAVTGNITATGTGTKLTGYTQYLKNAFQTDIAATTNPKLLVAVVPRNATITGAYITVATTHAAHASNYWTAAVTDETSGNALLASSDANTTKTTTGISSGGGVTAFALSTLTLTGTTANLNVSAGDVITLTLTKASSAVTLVNPMLYITYKDR